MERKKLTIGSFIYLASVLGNSLMYGFEYSRSLSESRDPFISQELRQELIEYSYRNFDDLSNGMILIPCSFIYRNWDKPKIEY